MINLGLPTGEYALPDERAAVEGLGMTYIHIPVVWEAPREADFAAFCAARQAHAGQALLIHCAANLRVAVFLALYRILGEGLPPAAYADLAGFYRAGGWPHSAASADS